MFMLCYVQSNLSNWNYKVMDYLFKEHRFEVKMFWNNMVVQTDGIKKKLYIYIYLNKALNVY